MNQQESIELANKLLDDLRDRRGFRHLLESIELEDESLYNEIVDTLAFIIFEYIAGRRG